MDFIDKIRELSARVQKQLPHIQTEEATKNALVMPFISALGYNVFDPTEVTPELHADVGLKKGEKVDYAILKDGEPIILFECKWHGADLNKEHASQLYRYFSVTTARFGVLTNGIMYRFYTDLEASNKMDAKPFFEFSLADVREQDVEELKKFTKSAYDLSGILTTASELKYSREIQRIMAEQLQQPSEDFVKFFASQVYEGRITPAIRDQFTQITRRALKRFINDQINERLKSALGGDTQLTPAEQQVTASLPAEESKAAQEQLSVVTTADEMQAYYVVKAVLYAAVDAKRVVLRDVQSYCSVLLDDNNRKPICRLYFNGAQKYIGLFDNDQRKETKIPVQGLDDLYQYADRLRATIDMYSKKPVS
jgi:hypothetical protein